MSLLSRLAPNLFFFIVQWVGLHHFTSLSLSPGSSVCRSASLGRSIMSQSFTTHQSICASHIWMCCRAKENPSQMKCSCTWPSEQYQPCFRLCCICTEVRGHPTQGKVMEGNSSQADSQLPWRSWSWSSPSEKDQRRWTSERVQP